MRFHLIPPPALAAAAPQRVAGAVRAEAPERREKHEHRDKERRRNADGALPRSRHRSHRAGALRGLARVAEQVTLAEAHALLVLQQAALPQVIVAIRAADGQFDVVLGVALLYLTQARQVLHGVAARVGAREIRRRRERADRRLHRVRQLLLQLVERVRVLDADARFVRLGIDVRADVEAAHDLLCAVAPLAAGAALALAAGAEAVHAGALHTHGRLCVLRYVAAEEGGGRGWAH